MHCFLLINFITGQCSNYEDLFLIQQKKLPKFGSFFINNQIVISLD